MTAIADEPPKENLNELSSTELNFITDRYKVDNIFYD